MAGHVGEKSGVGTSLEGNLNGQRCQGNGSTLASPSYWDTDDADEGEKPSELYGKYTWKIYKFSQINKRELRSSVFDVGGYKWYILIYPQGCDVSNHLSLFLCVANHDKLLPGWNHFVQFTIAVVNKDPKKSKYSDTLHRFWKKEHDWGWKKFMELSKLSDGFIDADALIIKAQVQVIRERSDWPFRCLDRQYQRELVRVYLSNVEHICRKTVDDKRKFLRTYYEDKAGWSSLSAFWLGMDQNARRHISREKTVVILKTMVKLFFVEKEVVSTLLMDFLYSGLKALEAQSKCSNRRVKLLGKEEMPVPVVYVERDLFALIDDTNLLLKRVHMGLLPAKDSKVPQNRIKEASAGEELDKDSIAQDEKHLTELGRSTVEIFVIDHIFNNKIVPAYEKAAAKKSKRASSSRKKKAS